MAEEDAEQARLARIYDALRERLLDLSLRNPMLNTRHRAGSKRQLQIVDEVPEKIYRLLAEEGAALEIAPLAEPPTTPRDELSEEFASALAHAKVADVEYLTRLRTLESTGRDDEFELAKAEREFRDRLRLELGLPPRPDRRTVNPIDHARSLGIDPSLELKAEGERPEHGDRKLQTLKWPDSLEATLETIAEQARLAEQETGLSTLFLAFGFLEWREKAESDRRLYAPLLLLPVRLDMRRAGRRKRFALAATAGAADVNLSLEKKLARDFGRILPQMEDDEGRAGSVEAYFDAVRQAVDGLKDWHVRRWLTLGHFASGRFAMFADLDPANWPRHPVASPLVGAVVGGTEMEGDGGSSLLDPPEDYPIDEAGFAAAAPFLIHDADASQHSALIDVMRGVNLVVQGPPGTGKSQTITNVIANALAAGRKVLFLAEKQAALDVVKRRLDAAGLGAFCLELHSEKAQPRLVVESLKERYALGVGGLRRPLPPIADSTWQRSRDELAAYAAAMNRPDAGGQTPFAMIWRALRARSEAGEYRDAFRGLAPPAALLDDPALGDTVAETVRHYAVLADGFAAHFGPPAASPWNALRFGRDANAGLTFGLAEDLALLAGEARGLGERLAGAAAALGIGAVAELKAAAAAEPRLPPEPPDAGILLLVAGLDGAAVLSLAAAKEALARILADGVDDGLAGAADAVLALPDRLAPHAERLGLAEAPPAELFAEAERRGAAARALAGALEAALPAVEALGADGSFASDGLAALAGAVYAATRLPAGLAPWYGWRPAGGMEAFAALRAEWDALADAEARWRSRFPIPGSEAWPAAEELMAAAELSGKRGLSAMFGALGGSGRQLAAMAARLGLASDARIEPADLTGLAAHVRALAAFTENRANRQMLGAAWAGLDSPFEAIAKAVKFAETAEARLRPLPLGDLVCDLMAELDAAGLARLAAASPALEAFRRLPRAVQEGLPPSAIASVAAEKRAEAEAAAAILAADPDRQLAAFLLPLAALRRDFAAERRRRPAAAALAAHPLAGIAERLAGTPEAAAASRAAVAWAAAVKGAGLPPEAQAALLSSDAAAARRRLAAAVAEGMEALAAVEARIAAIAAERGVEAIPLGEPAALAALAEDLSGRQDELHAFLSLQELRWGLEDHGAGPFLARAEAAGLPPAVLHPLFTGLLARRRAERLRRGDPVLSRAAGARIEATRGTFAERDRRKIEADRAAVRNELMTARPPAGSRQGGRREWTETALLENEFSKERRFLPVREMIRRAGGAIQAMKPCFMMSPLSLAKFVPAGRLRFDLLVIDEASQMRPEDALGGLLRADQIVVVGDQKQLPPTDFFARAAGSEEEDELEDLDDESILEACQKTFRRIRLLRWHYRSRCESLIRFSNENFYRNGLVTFPTARPGSFSIDLIRVAGGYEAHRNPAEALAVAEAAIAFMRGFAETPAAEVPTLGIVAVNTEQRDLIFEELRRLGAGDEAVERYRETVAERGEPVFVKNLENVQGDERDFILISLTYGPKPGRVAVLQRFGPINRKQGHRRLNVLFSRARRRIALFASMGPADIHPTEASSEGVHVLRRYLEYAESGGRTAAQRIGARADSDFEAEVAERLAARGYRVDLQVGVSGYRIDLGVRHPDDPERFLAGIECDGARYHSSRSARDRDRLREEVLAGLGWDILRVWSTDWFDNPELQTGRLVERLEALRARPLPPADLHRFAGAVPPAGPAAPAAAEGLPERLRAFRDTVIAAEMAPWEAHRSILRDGMIETFVAQRIADPEDWFSKIPQFQRAATNPVEKTRYLDRICEMVAEG